MNTHTPGPWEVGYYIHNERGWFVKATSDSIPICGGQYVSAATKANARLIAAAPDLLSALIRLREWVRRPGVDDGLENKAVIDQADTAIAKAEAREGK